MNIIELYEDLKKHIEKPTQYDNLFYDATEGESQIDIVKDILMEIYSNL